MWEGREFCLRCQALRTMRISVNRRQDPDAKDSSMEILTRIYHCDVCLAVVRSKDISEEIAPEEQPGDNPMHWVLSSNRWIPIHIFEKSFIHIIQFGTI